MQERKEEKKECQQVERAYLGISKKSHRFRYKRLNMKK